MAALAFAELEECETTREIAPESESFGTRGGVFMDAKV